jgi:hypothetical protein
VAAPTATPAKVVLVRPSDPRPARNCRDSA